MSDTSDQIAGQIEQQRRELSDSMVELEEKVTGAINWRSQVEQRPMMMIGLAFGGGVLLSALLGQTSRPRNRTTSATWENLKGALLGVAVAKAGSAVEHLLPGFHEEYQKAQAGTAK